MGAPMTREHVEGGTLAVLLVIVGYASYEYTQWHRAEPFDVLWLRLTRLSRALLGRPRKSAVGLSR